MSDDVTTCLVPLLPQDTGGSRVREQPDAPSPLQISASAPAAAPALHPHIAPPSALLPFMSTAAPQPGLTGSSHAFQVGFLHIWH